MERQEVGAFRFLLLQVLLSTAVLGENSAGPSNQLSTGTFAPKGAKLALVPLAPPTAALGPAS